MTRLMDDVLRGIGSSDRCVVLGIIVVVVIVAQSRSQCGHFVVVKVERRAMLRERANTKCTPLSRPLTVYSTGVRV
jgi:hypothetical protein